MRPPARAARIPGDAQKNQDDPVDNPTRRPRQGLDFLKREFARAISAGDDQHAELIRQMLDRLLNGGAR